MLTGFFLDDIILTHNKSETLGANILKDAIDNIEKRLMFHIILKHNGIVQ